MCDTFNKNDVDNCECSDKDEGCNNNSINDNITDDTDAEC